MSDEYLTYARKMVDLDKLDREIEAVTAKNCNDFHLFDYRNEFHGRPEYFFNADHINPAGVNIITQKLKIDLEKTGNADMSGKSPFK